MELLSLSLSHLFLLVRQVKFVKLSIPTFNESLRVPNLLELIEVGAAAGEAKGGPCHPTHHLAAEEITQVAGVHVRHKEVGGIASYGSYPCDVGFRCGGGGSSGLEVFAEKVDHVLPEAWDATERGVVDGFDRGGGGHVEFILHRLVDIVETGDELREGCLSGDTLEESGYKLVEREASFDIRLRIYGYFWCQK